VSAGDRFLWAAAEDHGKNQDDDNRVAEETGRRTFREFLELPKLSGVENLRLFLYLVVLSGPGPKLCSCG